MASSSSSPPSSSSSPHVMKDGDHGNWAELPPDLTSSILVRLGAIEILENAQKVCRSWRRVCKDPSMWRKIDMRNPEELSSPKYDLEIMCRHAVDRSQGGLLEIEIWYFGTDSLLNYIADRSSNLRSLKFALSHLITGEGLIQAVLKLPLLEELEVSYGISLSKESLKVVGQSCPNLKTLKVNKFGYRDYATVCDDDALAIAETMPGLRHLQLFGNRLSNNGLNAILNNCPNLEHLDLRQCFNLNLVGDLEKRFSERIKDLRRPTDSTHDYTFDAMQIAMLIETDSSEDDIGCAGSLYYDFLNVSDNSDNDELVS
uniref:F-box protein SKIP19 n=1 Tax=Noccaea caerulescens TaxID=107243 RepID=A0A1J3EUQ5_NOCCA